MGIKHSSNTVNEFDIDGNGIELVYQHENSILDFAHSMYQDNKLIISGGSYFKLNTARQSVMEITLKIEDGAGGRLLSEKRELPSMKIRRRNHCSVIIRDHLFLFFGYQENNYKTSDTLEYLNLKDPDASFRIMKINCYDGDVIEPMIFPDITSCIYENAKQNKLESKIFFFGGNQPKKR